MTEIVERYIEETFVGCFWLYVDGTESYIEEYEWKDIIMHVDLGGEIGYEL